MRCSILVALLLLGLSAALPARAEPDCDRPAPPEQPAVEARGVAPPAPDLILNAAAEVAVGGQPHLLTTWRPCTSDLEAAPDAFRVEVLLHRLAGPGGATPVAVLILPGLETAVPSATPVVTAGGGTFLALDTWTGGNCSGCESLLLLRLDGHRLVPLDPPGAAVLRAVGQDGWVSGYDVRWEGWGGLCRACSPHVALRFRLEAAGLVEACTGHPELLAELAAETDRYGSAPTTPTDGAFARATSLFLAELNTGEPLGDAMSRYGHRLGALRDQGGMDSTMGEAAHTLHDAAVHAESRRTLDRGCPALALDPIQR